MHAPVPLIAALDKALTAYLQHDPDSTQKLAVLENKLIALELRGINITIYFVADNGQLHLRSFADDSPDTTISATPLALAELAFKQNADQALFGGHMTITGDTDAGQALQDILAGVDIDWEEQLSGLVGDVTAHQLGRGLRNLFHWGKTSKASIEADVSELLLHEVNLLPQKRDVEQFLDDVDTLRADLERFSIRLDRFDKNRQQVD